MPTKKNRNNKDTVSFSILFCFILTIAMLLTALYIIGQKESNENGRGGTGTGSPSAVTEEGVVTGGSDPDIFPKKIDLNVEVDGNGKPIYNRVKNFGEAWLDVDKNGCDTRNDILGRDLTEVTIKKKGTSSCPNATVQRGTLNDPYTGEKLLFERGAGKQRDGGIQIDHIVPLKNAFDRGAYGWSQEARENFANDPKNLVATKSELNQSKKAKGITEWLPPNETYQCEYATKYISVLENYGLLVTGDEIKVKEKVCS